jgi:prepilin-type N-terminal cleavage/methylation domain-containing protein
MMVLHMGSGRADRADMGRASPRCAGLPASTDSGFTLIEAVVALFVLGIIFTALAASAMGSLRASMTARVEQQAIDFATEALEKTRAADYYELANVSADLSSDPRVSACGSEKCIDPGTGTTEPLVLSATGNVNPHVSTVNVDLSNNVVMNLYTYITRPADSTADYKRVTVLAKWQVAGHQRERAVSSLVTVTDRGLPLPVFKLTPLGGTSASVNPDTKAPFGFELTNQGAPDRWNLAFTGSAPSKWTLYRDDGDGIWQSDPTIDVPLTNTNSDADALIDTGRIDPTASVIFWAIREVDDSTLAGDYWSTMTATSAAQPSVETSTSSVDLLVRVVSSGTAVVVNPGGGQQGTAPGAPENLLVTSGNGQLILNWTPPASVGSSAITDYVVSYKLKGGATWTVFNDGVSTSTTATVTGLVNDSIYELAVAAKNSVGVGAQGATAEGAPIGTETYIAPTKCPASPVPPAGQANNGYTLRQYALHNRSAATPDWPGAGVPPATSTIGQGLPLSAAVDGAQVPVQTNLPVYSSDILATERGRILLAGGSLSTSDTTRVVDWRSTVGSKAYKGKAVLVLWVAPVSIDDATLPLELTGQLYVRKSNGTLQAEGSAVTASYSANTYGVLGCTGWKQVWMQFDVNQSSLLGSNEYVGVRVWNSATSGDTSRMQRLKVAYDVVTDFPSYLTLPEKP